MAKTSAALAPPPFPAEEPTTTAAEAPTEPTEKSYDFAIEVFEAIPDLGLTTSRHGALPWQAQWSVMAPLVLEDGKARGFYIPATYFVDRRGVKELEKVTHGYIKQKVGDEWRKWLDEDATRAGVFELAKGNRTGKEEGYTDKGMGVLVILKKLKK